MNRFSLFLFAIFMIIFVSSENIQKNRVLVLLDSLVLNTTHSVFFSDLRSKGYNLDIKMVNAYNYKLKEFGEFLYDQIIVFCTSELEPRSVKASSLLEFFDSGRNLLIAGDIDMTKTFRHLFNNLGVEVDEIGSNVVDHFNNSDPYDHSLISTRNMIDSELFSKKVAGPILYRGVGLSLTNYENYQVYGLLRAGEYAYSKKNDGSEGTLNMGNAIVLMAATQGTNNARAILSGSLDMFSNELYYKSKGANREYINNLIEWNFGLKGILRVGKIYHHKINETRQEGEYKINDNIEYTIEIEKYDHIKFTWIPFEANDILLEFVMMDPYVRMFLTKDPEKKSSKFIARFQLPDKYGVFQFKVIYRRPGYSFLNEATKVTVRPFKHNEFERYLFQAYPYYFGVFSTIVCFFIFFGFFLFDNGSISKKNE